MPIAVTAAMAFSSATFDRWSAWTVSCSRRSTACCASCNKAPCWRAHWRASWCPSGRGATSTHRYHDKMIDRWWLFFLEPNEEMVHQRCPGETDTETGSLRPPTNYDTAEKQTTVSTLCNSSHNIHVSLFLTLNMYFAVEKNEALPSHLPASSPACDHSQGVALLNKLTHAPSPFITGRPYVTFMGCQNTQRILPPLRARW